MIRQIHVGLDWVIHAGINWELLTLVKECIHQTIFGSSKPLNKYVCLKIHCTYSSYHILYFFTNVKMPF